MMVTCNGIAIVEHDGRGLGLPNTPVALVVLEYDNNRTEM